MSEQKKTAEQILRELLRKKGTDYCREGLYFVNAFEELGGTKEEVRLLKYLAEAGGPKALLDAEGQSPAMRQTIYSQTVKRVCDHALISEELSHKICACFWQAVYDEEPPVRFTPEPAPEKKPKKKTEAGKEADTKPFPQKWILLGIGLVLVLVLVCLALSGTADAPGGEGLPWDARLPEAISGYAVDPEILALVEAGTENTYAYQDGAHLAMYFDEAGNERCRIYVNSGNEVEYVFTAEYDGDSRIVTHKTFDQAGTLIRTDLLTYSEDGGILEEKTLLEGDALAEITSRTWDAEDRFISTQTRAGDGTVLYSARSEYDEDGQETYTSWFYDGSGYEERYDTDGNILSEVWRDGETVTRSTVYTYHSDGSTGEQTSYNADGTVSGIWTTQYDANGVITQSEGSWYQEDGAVDDTSRTEYDANGNPVKQVWYDVDGAVKYTYQTEYDADGKRIKQIRYDADGTQSSVQTELYVSHGLNIGSVTQTQEGRSISESLESILGTPIKDVEISSGKTAETCIRTYDVMGNRIQSVGLDENGNTKDVAEWEHNAYGCTTKYTFTGYDEAGNVDFVSVTEYNQFGKELLETMTFYRDDGFRVVTQRDADGQVLSQEIYDANGNLTESE
ncbi:MAG: hypothetical protein ACI4PH_08845 [Faecousia sp.]